MRHIFNMRGTSTIALLASIAFALSTPLDARIAYTTLDDLVNASDLVFLGQTTHHPGATPDTERFIVWFKVDVLVKAPPGVEDGDIPVCENSSFTDTFELRKNPGTYVVFAKRRGPCFSPVAGYKSLISVEDGAVRTAPIDEQPNSQPLEAFLGKLRAQKTPK